MQKQGIVLLTDQLCTKVIECSNLGSDHDISAVLEVLPRCLDRAGSFEWVGRAHDDGDEDAVKGHQYKNETLEQLCNHLSMMPPRLLVKLANMFNDISLNAEMQERVVSALLGVLDKVDTLDLPQFVNQLLLISTKGQKTAIVQGILEHFNKLDEMCRKMEETQGPDDDEIQLTQVGAVEKTQLRETEGTVIANINFAAKQDPEVRNAFLDYMKAPGASALTCFNTVLLLSLATIKRFEEKVFAFLKTLVQHYFDEKLKREESTWRKALVHLQELPNIEATMCDMLQYSAHGWDNITPSLISFGVLLMDLSGGRAKDSQALVAARDLGQRVLEQCYDSHEEVRSSIYNHVVQRIVSGDSNMLVFIALLKVLLRKRFYMIEHHIPRVQEVLQYLPFLPPKCALSILDAITPLLRSTRKEARSFQDHVVLVLRKAMCRHEASARLIAVRGFSHLLRETMLAASSDSSASQLSQAHEMSEEHSELYVEISAFMRRCMSQQAEIREALYTELYPIFAVCKNLRDCVLDILVPQFMHLVETDVDATVPLKRDLCHSKKQGAAKHGATAQSSVHILEPLPQLMCCLQRCIRCEQRAHENGEGVVDAEFLGTVASNLDRVSAKLEGCQLEDLGLEPGRHIDVQTQMLTQPEGAASRTELQLFLGCSEVMIEYALSSSNNISSQPGAMERLTQMSNDFKGEKDAAKLMNTILRTRAALSKATAAATKAGGKGVQSQRKRGRASGDEPAKVVDWKWEEGDLPCSVTCAAEMAMMLQKVREAMSTRSAHLDEGAATALCHYIVKVCHHNLAQMSTGSTETATTEVLEAVAQIGPCLREEMRVCMERGTITTVAPTAKEDKGHAKSATKPESSHVSKCLECIRMCVDILAPYEGMHWLVKCVTPLNGMDTEEDCAGESNPEAQLALHIQDYESLCEEVLRSEKPDCKAAERFIEVIMRLCKQLPIEEKHRHSRWFQQRLREDFSTATKTVVPELAKAFLHLNRGAPEEMCCGEGISEDLLAIWQKNVTEEDEESDEDGPKLNSITDETAPGVGKMLLEWADHVAAELEWMHANLQQESNGRRASDQDDDDDETGTQQGPQSRVRMLENEVFDRTQGLMMAMLPLFKSQALDQKIRVQMMSLGIRIYKLLSGMLKYALLVFKSRKKAALARKKATGEKKAADPSLLSNKVIGFEVLCWSSSPLLCAIAGIRYCGHVAAEFQPCCA